MFNPTLKTRLVIDGTTYRFSPHPAAPALVWGQEGRHAIVYRIEPLDGSGAGREAYALKVFRPAFRHAGLLTSAQALRWAHELPGMRVCDQTVITRETHPRLVAEHEDLEYAMVMPWIDGQTWFDYLHKRERLTLDQCRALAESIAWVLYALELNALAHCDLSSGNVIIDPSQTSVHLVDVEDLYSPWLLPPPQVPTGTPGYQHREVGDLGQWRPAGDRFAGAVLMAEVLAWAHPQVRAAAYGESYFAPQELQQDNERYRLLLKVLKMYDRAFAEVFEAAWRSPSLEACPPLKTWYDLFDGLPRGPVASWAPINPREFAEQAPRKTAAPAATGESLPEQLPRERRSSSQGARSRRRRRRSGCRAIAIAVGVGMLLCCYALILAMQWSVLQNIF